MNRQEFVRLPEHIGYIIDGNGRWAKERNKPRSYGHKIGFEALRKILKATFDLGIKYVSVYAFSTENWNRPKDEVDYLFKLIRNYLKTDFKKDFKDVRLNIMGDYTKFPKDLSDACKNAIEDSKEIQDHILNLGINYGGRDEIIRAINLAKNNDVAITKENFGQFLYTSNQPDPDFIIRTSGEQRISNFMLWQSAYSEFYFPKTYWPAFDEKELVLALHEFEKRNRRYGSISKTDEN